MSVDPGESVDRQTVAQTAQCVLPERDLL